MKWLFSKCRRFEGALALLATGDLAGPSRAELEAHVAACPDCRARLAELQALVAGCRSLPQTLPAVEPPVTLRQRWSAAIRDDQPTVEASQSAKVTPWWPGRRLAWGSLVGIWVLALIFRVSGPQAPKPALSVKTPSLQEVKVALTLDQPQRMAALQPKNEPHRPETNPAAPRSQQMRCMPIALGISLHEPKRLGRSAGLETGDTAGLETCATRKVRGSSAGPELEFVSTRKGVGSYA